MTKIIKKYTISLLALMMLLTLVSKVRAEYPYNFPTHSKVKITRDPNGDSWLYLEFKWDESCPPNFEKGKAVEFEIGIVPKCFLRPKGGEDNEFNCNKVMGENGIYYNLPNDFIPEINANNCYVDLWNYWNPPWWDIVSLLEENCGNLDSKGETCAQAAAGFGAFKDPIGNFAVGLHDASALQAGIMYSIRYPVEVNDSDACKWGPNGDISDGKWCDSETPIWENKTTGYSSYPGSYTLFEGWGRAQITMQTFNSKCDLPDSCDDSNNTYTCPHLIGVSSQDGACKNVDKNTGFWLSSLCVPTDDYKFVPGLGYKESGETCTTRGHDSLLSTNVGDKKACCIDLDGDGYYGYSQKDLYGRKIGDCNDNNEYIHPGAHDTCGNNIDEDCDGDDSNICIAGGNGGCPQSSECETGDHFLSTCPNGVDYEEMVCENCEWVVISTCPPPGSCQPGTQQSCGSCGTTTCGSNGEWGSCLNQGACSPGQTQQQSCNSVGTQTRTCGSNCAWSGWGQCTAECSPGQTQQQSCTVNGQSGTKERTCNSSGQWGSWSGCQSSCQDVYVASGTQACYNNPQGSGNPTICLNVQQNSGSSWKYRICKSGSSFSTNFDYELRDDNLSQSFGNFTGSSGTTCTPWKTINVSYIPGYGVINGAGLMGYLASPAGCTQAACQYKTGYLTIRKECQ